MSVYLGGPPPTSAQRLLMLIIGLVCLVALAGWYVSVHHGPRPGFSPLTPATNSSAVVCEDC